MTKEALIAWVAGKNFYLGITQTKIVLVFEISTRNEEFDLVIIFLLFIALSHGLAVEARKIFEICHFVCIRIRNSMVFFYFEKKIIYLLKIVYVKWPLYIVVN